MLRCLEGHKAEESQAEGDLVSGATWNDLQGFTWDDLGRLRWSDLERWTGEVWQELRSLTPSERAALLDALTGSAPPGTVEWGVAEQQSALTTASKYAPKNAAEMAAYLGVLVALLTFLTTQFQGDEEPPTAPPPPQVVVIHIPPEHHPIDPCP